MTSPADSARNKHGVINTPSARGTLSQPLCEAAALSSRPNPRADSFYEVGGKLCDPAIAKEAIARGWVCPLDFGLFGPAFAQSWHFRGAF